MWEELIAWTAASHQRAIKMLWFHASCQVVHLKSADQHVEQGYVHTNVLQTDAVGTDGNWEVYNTKHPLEILLWQLHTLVPKVVRSHLTMKCDETLHLHSQANRSPRVTLVSPRVYTTPQLRFSQIRTSGAKHANSKQLADIVFVLWWYQRGNSRERLHFAHWLRERICISLRQQHLNAN